MSNKQLDIYDALGVEPPYKQRHLNDFYETPVRLTQKLLNRIHISGSVFEPCAGGNAIANVLREDPKISDVHTSDYSWEQSAPKDATTKEFWQHWGENDWIVTNPPFNQAHLILPLALEHCKVGVAFLLRSSYTEPCGNRAEWLIENSDRHRYRIEINPRPQFRKEKGSDTASCSWLVWKKDFSWAELGLRSPFQYITNWK